MGAEAETEGKVNARTQEQEVKERESARVRRGEIIRSVIVETDHAEQVIGGNDRWSSAKPCHSISTLSLSLF